MNTTKLKMAARLITCGLLGFALAGTAAGAAESTQAAMPTADAKQVRSETMENIKKRDKLLVGNKFSFQTFNYKNPATGKNEGYMADLARALAIKILGDENKIEFRQTTDETRFDMMAKGDVDVLIDLIRSSPEKEKLVDFSDVIFHSGSGLLVKKGSPIKSIDDIKKGTRVLYVGENLDVKFIKAKVPDATYIEFEHSKDAVEALKAGKGDVFTQVVTHLFRAASQNPEYVVVNRFTDKPYRIAVKKGDTAMRDYVNDFIRGMTASGELDRLYTKWFGPYGGANIDAAHTPKM